MIVRQAMFKTIFLSQSTRRWYTNRNILKLAERDFVHDIFPDNAGEEMRKVFQSSPQAIYAGFDPTANSLHVGNLLVLMGLLHSQRAGHQSIALLGGATGLIGDPSGRNKERNKIVNSTVEENLCRIKQQIERIFRNHSELFWDVEPGKELKEVKIINNADWYAELNLIDFIANMGRHFRIGCMLSRSSVQSRIASEAGMSFTEFTYQIFQAYDWWHLFKTYNCRFQLGGSDQMGNLMSGQELISRVENKSVFGITLPIVTNEEGDKFGKSAGNAIWLDSEKTSPFSLYQFFIRVPDSQVEKLLKLFTFLSLSEIKNIMQKQTKIPELREAQKCLAQQVTLLVHGEAGLKRAETITDALYKGSVSALGEMDCTEIQQTLAGATICEILPEAGMSILQLSMKANCFPTESDAIRIITAGGFYINQKRAQNISEVISPGIHILKNGLTVIRIGKKNYHIIKWFK